MTYEPGDIVLIGGDSIIAGQKGCVIADLGDEIYCCTNGGLVGADFPIRHTFEKEIISNIERKTDG